LVRIELYTPNGIESVRLTSVWVYWQACLNGDPLCEAHVSGFAERPAWAPGPSETGEQGWIDLSEGWSHLAGRWADWPGDLPPRGYGGPDATRAWQASLGFAIEDTFGHQGNGGCSGAFIPSETTELECSVFFLH
jgi:hypothetical protein